MTKIEFWDQFLFSTNVLCSLSYGIDESKKNTIEMKSHDNLSLTKLSFGDITLFTISSDLTRQLLFYSETNTILTIGWIHQLHDLEVNNSGNFDLGLKLLDIFKRSSQIFKRKVKQACFLTNPPLPRRKRNLSSNPNQWSHTPNSIIF